LPDGSSGRSLVGFLPRFFHSSAARPTVPRTDRSSAYFLVPSAHQWLARLTGQIAHRLTSCFLPLVSGLPCSPDGSLIDLLPRSFRSSVACPARRTDRSSAYFLVSSAHRWLAGRIAHRLTSSFLPLISCLPDSSSGGSLVGLLPRFFRSLVARPTVPRTDRSSAYFLISSARQWLAGRIAHWLTSLYLPLVSGSPDGSLTGLLPCTFRSSVARQTDRSSANFLFSSARQWLTRHAEWSAHRLTSLFLPLVSGLPGSPDRSLIDLLPCSFCSSVACPARRMDHSSTYFLVPSARLWLDRRFLGRIARRLTSSFLLLVSGLPGTPNGALIGLLPCFFHSSVACPARRTDHSSTYFLAPSAHQWLAQLAGWITHRLISSFLPLVCGLTDGS